MRLMYSPIAFVFALTVVPLNRSVAGFSSLRQLLTTPRHDIAASLTYTSKGESCLNAHISQRTDDDDPTSFNRRSFLGTSATVASAMTAAGGVSSSKPVAAAETSSSVTVAADTDSAAAATATTPRIVLWGYGNQNQLMAKYLHERNMNVVAVISHHGVGDDYGLVESAEWGNIGSATGVRIVDEASAAEELERTQPNVCLLCTRSTLSDIKPALSVCAKAKVNVITIAEELLDSTSSSPKLTKEIDQLFRDNGVTLTGSGFIDGACCEMTMVMASMMHKISALEGGLQYNVDAYGTVLANAHGVGLTKQEFAKFAKSPTGDKSYVYNANEWFVSALGLTLKETKEVREPTFGSMPLTSTAIGREIPVGDCTGMKVVCTTTTKEGVTIVSQQIGKCYQEGVDQDRVSWSFQGEPAGVSFSMDNPPTPQMTNTATISRIPQIIAAPPGYITSDKLDFGRYKHFV